MVVDPRACHRAGRSSFAVADQSLVFSTYDAVAAIFLTACLTAVIFTLPRCAWAKNELVSTPTAEPPL